MSFDLCNTPSSFMRLMNKVLHPFLNKMVVVDLDNIFIYSKSTNDHMCHLRSLFEKLRKQKLYDKLEECELLISSVAFLGHIVSQDRGHVDPEKVKTISSWLAPTNAHECQIFHGLTSSCRDLSRISLLSWLL